MAFNAEQYEIRSMVKEDVDEVAKLFAIVFSEREPMISNLKMSENDVYEKIGKDWVAGCAQEDLSLVCVDKTRVKGNQIVGFRLTSTLNLKTIRGNKVDNSANYKQEQLVGILMSEFKEKWLESHPELTCDENDQKHLIFLGLGVIKEFENQQIGTKLVEASLKDAKLRGFKYGIVVCTASRSQYIFEKKFKFKRVFFRPYKDIEYNGYKYLANVVEPPEVVLYEIDFDCVE